MSESGRSKQIIENLNRKVSTKQQVFKNTKAQFEVLKKVLEEIVSFYHQHAKGAEFASEIKYQHRGYYDAKLKVGGDMLVFHMHTNVFGFEPSHPIWKKGYIQQDEMRSYCGMINIYNFLADSFKYNRLNDAGYLIARVFINKENHFFVEGKKKLGFLFNDLPNDTLLANRWREIVEEAILFAIEFDLLTPDFNRMGKASVSQIMELTKNSKLSTDKRLGFRFAYEEKGLK